MCYLTGLLPLAKIMLYSDHLFHLNVQASLQIRTRVHPRCSRIQGELDLPAAALLQIELLSVDNPLEKCWQSLRAFCPNLQMIALSHTHLAMTFEYASRRNKDTRFQHPKSRLAEAHGKATPLQVHGTRSPRIRSATPSRSPRNARVRGKIEDRSMRKPDAEQVLNSLDVWRSLVFVGGGEWVGGSQLIVAIK